MYQDAPQDVIDFVNSQFKDFEITFAYDDAKTPYSNVLASGTYWPTTIIVDQEGIIYDV